MSQEQNPVGIPQDEDARDDFDAGFDQSDSPSSPQETSGAPEREKPLDSGEESGPGGEESPKKDPLFEQAEDDGLPVLNDQPPSLSPEGEQRQEQTVASPEKIPEVPEEIADEFEALKRLNPQAAELALEDSPDGAGIRARLEQYGAEIAQDRAESILEKREFAIRAEQADAERNRQAVEAHNRRFMNVLRRDHPEYTAMLTDPRRQVEAAKTMQEIYAWIGAKPYAEAEPLMRIAREGRDPEQVSALLTRFYSERNGASTKRPGPEGAFAVPSRGAASAPSGSEDADDFEAGFNL